MPSLAQQNGFGSTFLHTMFEAHKKPKQKPNTPAREELIKYDLTTGPYIYWPIFITIGPGGLLLVVSHLFAVPV